MIGQCVRGASEIPISYGAPQPAAPPSELFDVPGEQEQMSAGATDTRQCLERMLAQIGIVAGSACREREDRRLLFWSAPRLGDRDDFIDGALAVERDAAKYSVAIVFDQFAFGRVVRAAVDTEYEETVQPGPVVNRPYEAARAVGDLCRAVDRV